MTLIHEFDDCGNGCCVTKLWACDDCGAVYTKYYDECPACKKEETNVHNS